MSISLCLYKVLRVRFITGFCALHRTTLDPSKTLYRHRLELAVKVMVWDIIWYEI